MTTVDPEANWTIEGLLLNRQAMTIDTNGRVEMAVPRNGKDFTLEELRALIGAEMVEIVRPRSMPDWLIVCDEEGKLKGDGLVNFIATRAYGNDNDMIVGRVLLCLAKQVK
jgi:hypothetical protein